MDRTQVSIWAHRAGSVTVTVAKILVSLVILVFAAFAVLNALLDFTISLVQLAIWSALVLPGVPALYAIEATEKRMLVRLLLAALSLVLIVAVFWAINVYG
jgi:hypothetical protein